MKGPLNSTRSSSQIRSSSRLWPSNFRGKRWDLYRFRSTTRRDVLNETGTRRGSYGETIGALDSAIVLYLMVLDEMISGGEDGEDPLGVFRESDSWRTRQDATRMS